MVLTKWFKGPTTLRVLALAISEVTESSIENATEGAHNTIFGLPLQFSKFSREGNF